MVHYICKFQLVNVIKDFILYHILCQQESHCPYFQRFSNLLDTGERKSVCVVPHNILNSSIPFCLHLELKL